MSKKRKKIIPKIDKYIGAKRIRSINCVRESEICKKGGIFYPNIPYCLGDRVSRVSGMYRGRRRTFRLTLNVRLPVAELCRSDHRMPGNEVYRFTR